MALQGLTYRPVQIEGFSRPQNHSDWKLKIGVWRDRKHGGERRKCSLPVHVFSSFPTVFSKSFLCLPWDFNPLPNDKILDVSKLKGIADDKIKETENFEICFVKDRKHCGKRRKCWLPAFSPFPTMFSRGFFLRGVKSRDCVVMS